MAAAPSAKHLTVSPHRCWVWANTNQGLLLPEETDKPGEDFGFIQPLDPTQDRNQLLSMNRRSSPLEPCYPDGTFDGALGGDRMTIVVAMRESDAAILIAADREFTDDRGLKARQQKLKAHRRHPLAWGCSGPQYESDQFSKWLSDSEPLTASDGFIEQAATRLAQVNGALKKRVEEGGSGWNPRADRVSCLLAGFLDRVPQIIELDGSGHIAEHWADGFYAIGAGGAAAAPLYGSNLGARLSPLRRLQAIMKTIIERVPGCGGPIDIARLTPDKAQPLETWEVRWVKTTVSQTAEPAA